MRSEQEKTPRQERCPVSLMSRLWSMTGLACPPCPGFSTFFLTQRTDSAKGVQETVRMSQPLLQMEGPSSPHTCLAPISPFPIIHCLKDKGEPLLSSSRPLSHYGGNKPAFKKFSNLPRVALDPIQTPQIHSPKVQLPQPPQGF